MEFAIYFIFGLIVGSFLNVVIFRLHKRESIVYKRSHCPHCNHGLSALDLVPVISFLLLAGRCRYCRKSISWQYPLVELATGLSFGFLAWHHQFVFGWEFFSDLVFAAVFLVIAIYDFKHFLILDKIVFPFAAFAAISAFVADINTGCGLSLNCELAGGIVSGLIVAGFFLIQYLASNGRWIGFGDVKFGLLFGIALGWPLSLVALFLSYVLGAIAGIILMASGKKEMSSRLPFGSFLSISAIITMIVGPAILSWYLNLIGF